MRYVVALLLGVPLSVSASHASSRSVGQQFTMRLVGIDASLACASAVSAYSSCSVLCASLSSANRQPARAPGARPMSMSCRAGSPSSSMATLRFAAARNTAGPVGDDAAARAVHPAARVPEDVHAGRVDEPEEARRLILGDAQLCVRRRDDEVETREVGRLEVERAVGADVGLDALEHVKTALEPPSDRVDLLVLARHRFDRHAARRREPVRVIGDRHARYPRVRHAAASASIGSRPSLHGECIWKSPR